MSGGGKSQTQVTETKLPEWVDKAAQSNYAKAQNIAGREYKPYEGETVAGLSGDTLGALDFIRNNVGMYSDNFDSASKSLSGLLNFGARDVNAGSVTPQKLSETDLNPYLNPYIKEVENNATSNLDRSRRNAINQNSSDAAKASSFGGSRHAIIDAVTNAESARQAGDLSAQLRKAGFDSAQSAAVGDITRDMQGQTTNLEAQLKAAMSNQNADIAGAGVRTNAANSLVNAGTAGQDSFYKDMQALLGSGSILEEKEQQYLDRDKAQFDEAQNYDKEQLNLLLASLGMSPYGKTETTTKSGGGGGSDWATAGLGAAKMLMGLFSEDDAKTDIEKVGHDDATGLDVYAYRYKNDPKTYPKVTGIMASDVEKKYPKAVKRIGGKKGKRVIDMSHIGV